MICRKEIYVCYVLKMLLVVYLWLSYRQAPHSLRPVIYLMRSNIRLLVNRRLSTAQSTCHTDWATDKNWQIKSVFWPHTKITCCLISRKKNVLVKPSINTVSIITSSCLFITVWLELFGNFHRFMLKWIWNILLCSLFLALFCSCQMLANFLEVEF